MNKTYRLIWSKIKEAWIIVSENVKGNGGPAPVTVGAALVVASLAVCSGVATALPTGAQIVNGTAGIVTNGSTMTVTNSANAIINWQGFSIGSSETTRFIQPSAVSAVLNRVTGGNPSQILGTLQSNGKVLLINPSGIIFGAGARVDVGGLIASSLDIANQDFLAGRMKFTAGAMAGKVENQGAITTPSGGQVYLIAPDVTNSGVITAPNGDVLLAAGKEVLLVDSSNPEIALVVTAPDGQALNLGTIVADAGRVGMYGSIVRHQGRISADSAVQDASGRIFFKATKEVTLDSGSITTANGPTGGTVIAQAAEGTTLVSGTIEAKGSSGSGGTVQVLGQYAGLIDNATIDTSGTNGGGTVLVGGDYQGKNIDIQNAEATYMGKDTVIKADATDTGNGGKVILWSDNTTRAYGSIFARGGANGGDGGFVETSGKGYLDFNADVSTLAPHGKAGTLLLDPTNIWIATDQTAATAAGMPGADTSITTNGGPNFFASGVVDDSLLTVSALQTALGGGNVTVSTVNASGSGAGNITVANPVSFTSNNLTLNAANNINVIGGITSEGLGTVISLNAGNQINLTGGIGINFNADSFGSVYFDAGSGGITGTGQIEALQLKVLSGGSATVNYMVQNLAVGPENGIVAANVTAGNLILNMNGSDGAYSVGSIGGTNGITATGAVSLNTTGALAVTDSISASSGDVSLVASGTSSDISVFEGGSIQGLNVTLNAGRDLVVTGGTVFANDSPLGDVTVTAGRDVKVFGGAEYDDGSIKAANDVKITATTGKLYLTSGSSTAAIVEANAIYTVYLNFPGQTSGGYVIDGDSSGVMTSGTNPFTGIFVYGSPADAGINLHVTYAAPPPPPPPPVPTLDACIANPVLSGCSTVLPTLDTCTTAPTTPGCSVVLPTIDTCTATPTAPGCTAVLPSLTTCTTTPTLPGCSVVLPSLTTCTSAPATAGCSAVLPSLTTCTSTPSTPGCSAVLPSLATCTSAPATAGCSVVLPPLTACILTPSLPGCSVVLPSLTSCITTPSLLGCSAVLPTLTTCTTTPSLPGCSVVLPSLTSCTTTPSLPGCSVVLPTLTTCTATPSLPGCSVVLPTVSTCLKTPSAPGCLVVVPQHEQQGLTGGSGTVINALMQIPTTPVAPAGLQLIGQVPPGTPPPAGGENGGNGGENDDKKNGARNNNQGGKPPAGDNKNDKARKMYCN